MGHAFDRVVARFGVMRRFRWIGRWRAVAWSVSEAGDRAAACFRARHRALRATEGAVHVDQHDEDEGRGALRGLALGATAVVLATVGLGSTPASAGTGTVAYDCLIFSTHFDYNARVAMKGSTKSSVGDTVKITADLAGSPPADVRGLRQRDPFALGQSIGHHSRVCDIVHFWRCAWVAVREKEVAGRFEHVLADAADVLGEDRAVMAAAGSCQGFSPLFESRQGQLQSMGDAVDLDIRVLGRVTVFAGGRESSLGPPQRRAVLAALALRAGDLVPAETLVDALWGAEPPATAANILHGHVARLRAALGPGALETRSPGYVLAVDPRRVDAVRFESLIVEARRHESAEARSAGLREALALWRGEPLADLGAFAFADTTRLRLAELRRAALDDCLDADLELGRYTESVPELEALVAEDPLRERTRGQLMVALYGSARQADALAIFEDARRTLAEELGLDPGPELRALEQAILRQELPMPQAHRVGRPRAADPPLPLTGLIGRDTEVTEIAALLCLHRLVTLTGPGGCGKTRLALAAAGRDEDVRWIDLSPVTSALDAVIPALGTEGSVRDLAVLGERLRDARLLLVLDNCEHLIGECAELVAALLRGCAGIRVLATSREPLGVPGEEVWTVPPLDPAAAAELFVRRASTGLPTDTAVEEICRRLDGIPLAIELAAARTRVLSPAEIAERLDDRFALLTDGGRVAPARHRTLTAVVDWSHDLLALQERVLFDRLSVCVGGFTLAVAEALAEPPGSGLDTLSRLVDKSLVLRENHSGASTRFRMLETLRHYGEMRLRAAGGQTAARRLHAAYYAEAVAGSDSHLAAPVLLLEEQSNLRAAATWALAHDEPRLAARIIAYGFPVWIARGPLEEAIDLAEQAQGRLTDPADPLWARLGYAVASMAVMHGDLRRAQSAAVEAMPSADAVTRARIESALGLIAWARGDYPLARFRTEQAVPELKRAGDHHGAALTLAHLARLMLDQPGDLDERNADRILREAVESARRTGLPQPLGFCLDQQAAVALRAGRLDCAAELAEQSFLAYRAADDGQGMGAALRTAALVARDLGDGSRALDLQLERLRLYRARGFGSSLPSCLEDLAELAADKGLFGRAATLLGAAEAMRADLGIPVPGSERDRRALRMAAARDGLGLESFREAWKGGIGMPPAQACEEASLLA